MLFGGAGFALLGGAFGAVTGVYTWRSGRAAGTWLGLSVARAFDRASPEGLSPGLLAAVVGGADGAVFGGLVGVGFGFLVSQGGGEWAALGPALLAVALLAACAVAFGGLAALIVRAGRRAVLWMFVLGILGAFLGYPSRGTDGLYLGLLSGALLGAVFAWLVPRPPGRL